VGNDFSTPKYLILQITVCKNFIFIFKNIPVYINEQIKTIKINT